MCVKITRVVANARGYFAAAPVIFEKRIVRNYNGTDPA
jgi:hypothetical protein